jgi:hypothetical protein
VLLATPEQPTSPSACESRWIRGRSLQTLKV